ncbi:MAG: dihydrodipicolinate synthase family protein [Quisquiliibacterium sp.]
MNPGKATAFDGIWPILFAFFDANGGLDRDAMRRQVLAAIDWGAPGVAVLGLATEVNKLTVPERKQLIDWLAQDLAGVRPFAVTITGASVVEQRELADYAIGRGAAWLILQPPPVATTGMQSERFYFDFFAQVMADLPVPVGIQNAPEYLGVGLSAGALLELAAIRPNFQVLKGEASSTIIEHTIEQVQGRLAVLNGRGGLELIENLQAGCRGMIVAPDTADLQQQVYACLAQNRLEEAYADYAKILPAIVFAMQSLDTLICYGKRIAAWRLGLPEVHDRQPALAPTEFGLRIAREHARRLGPLGAGRPSSLQSGFRAPH